VLFAVIIALLFLYLRLVLCQIFSEDFRKIRNLPMIFLRSFENVTPGHVSYLYDFVCWPCDINCSILYTCRCDCLWNADCWVVALL